MCGIFGIVTSKNSDMGLKEVQKSMAVLFKLSETRGKESSGMAIKNLTLKKINVLKSPVPASQLIKTNGYKNFLKESLSKNNLKLSYPIAIIGHSRLFTNGTQEDNNNNQPVIKSNCVAVHNGIITNVNDLYHKYKDALKRSYEVDTEIFLDILRLDINQDKNLIEATVKIFQEIEGTASVAVLMNDLNKLLLATNTGSLYCCLNTKRNVFVFTSERYIISSFIKKYKKMICEIGHIKPFTGKVIDLENFSVSDFNFKNELLDKTKEKFIEPADELKDFSRKYEASNVAKKGKSGVEKLLEYNIDAISQLKRCTRCILPETFPFIKFDEEGVCNYCRNYKKIEYQGIDKLLEIVEPYRSKNGGPDCIVPFSGGRDSSYGLHYIKTVLKMNPVAFTYDWGMVTDLARRNQARICGKLGIEHILLSADIKKKRENIRKNVTAWLKKPDLGIIPLFMAGDKSIYSYLNKIKKQNNITLNIWSGNRMESTDFKAGFCGVKPLFYKKKRADYLTFMQSLQLAFYYLKRFLSNPVYLNGSIFDSIFGYYSQYFDPRRGFLLLYDYVEWNERKIERILFDEYDWETSPDTKTTWRIGDGTASFYNYIYYTIAGFTESETFRSNQIREGLITREEALGITRKENKPRLKSMSWYCDIVGLDFEKTVKKINSMPKLY